MMEIDIPGSGHLAIRHLVLDFNGTLAMDGELAPGVGELLTNLADKMTVHVLTADTFGTARNALAGIPCTVAVLPPGGQAPAKAEYVARLGASNVACVGNGRNDRLMLARAALGIAVIQGEGAARESVTAATIVCRDIREALGLFVSPRRLCATLRE